MKAREPAPTAPKADEDREARVERIRVAVTDGTYKINELAISQAIIRKSIVRKSMVRKPKTR